MANHVGRRLLVVLVGVVVLAGMGVVGAPPALAVSHVWEVNTTVDTNDGKCLATGCSLRDAVLEANASLGDDLIVLPGGYYLLTQTGTDDTAIAGDLDITAGSVTIAGPGVIDANGIDRVFHVVGSAAELELRNVTLTGGNKNAGGGIYNSHGTLSIVDATITGNTTGTDGGGIYNAYGTVIVTNSTILGNSATDLGGGIDNFNGTIAVTDSTITDNTADNKGGGISSYDGWVRVANSTITGNTASSAGGGLYSYLGTWTVVDSTITANTTGDDGGGIYNTYGPMRLINSTITNNDAPLQGVGGIFNDGGSVSLVDSSVSRNKVPLDRDCEGTLTVAGTAEVGNTSGCILLGAGGTLVADTGGVLGDLGIGTIDPNSPLHVEHASGLSDGVEVLARLESNINPQLIFTNSGAAALEANEGEPIEWFHAMTSDGEFKISRNGTDKVEAKFFANGDLTIPGDLRANSFITTSDEAAKTGFAPVDPGEVLAAVGGVEVGTWAFTSDPGTTHMGPTAQNFREAFGVGEDSTGIASVDVDGVALAAIQALETENDGLQAQVWLLVGLVTVLAMVTVGLVLVVGRLRVLQPVSIRRRSG